MSKQNKSVSKDSQNVAKRKRQDDPSDVEPRRRRKREKTTTASQPQRPKQIDNDDSVAGMDASILADHFAKRVRTHFPDSSSIEHQDLYLPTRAFRDTTEFGPRHIASNLPSFLATFTKGGEEELSSCSPGLGPHTLIITSSGIRTADVARELRRFNREKSQVGKLIAKHMKLKDNIEYMQKTQVGIAISTPLRFKDLLDHGALKVDNVKRIVVDGSYQDEKMRTIFDLGELWRPLAELLNREEIKAKYGGEGGIEIMVF
ncbi:hypothetical protein B0A52_05172 [Exophiala mesophila]|uniref:Protein CMS1 n=1 Tax=Exophiala mesophila TaxID=212818 RepID=A0A438N4A8_EXOME|nr:hypothetical protein B0A52_05172 [Exophiala mesophila]